jgi:15-cis-phytoene synthase
MTWSTEQSYTQCQRVAWRTGSNFYYSFLLLPWPKRRAMCALYAFLRHTDDLGDNPHTADVRRAELQRWRHSLARALSGTFDGPLFPALADTVARYRIPPEYLYAVIDGVLMDVDQQQYETFDELADYCHKVASVVGLACIHIWGFESTAAIEPAGKCGLAFQLTNILRDLKEDAAEGRVYLPRADLRRFDYSPEELKQGVRDGRFKALMRFEIARAEQFYHEAAALEPLLGADGRPIYAAMVRIYRGLLDEIKRVDGDVFTHRVRLSAWRKLGIAASCCLPGRAWPMRVRPL